MNAVSFSDSRTVGQTSGAAVAAKIFGNFKLTARGLPSEWLAVERSHSSQYPQASGHGHRS